MFAPAPVVCILIRMHAAFKDQLDKNVLQPGAALCFLCLLIFKPSSEAAAEVPPYSELPYCLAQQPNWIPLSPYPHVLNALLFEKKHCTEAKLIIF